MKTPVAVAFALALYWLGLVRGAESPGTTTSDFLVVALVLSVVAVLWELVARMLRSGRGSSAQSS